MIYWNIAPSVWQRVSQRLRQFCSSLMELKNAANIKLSLQVPLSLIETLKLLFDSRGRYSLDSIVNHHSYGECSLRAVAVAPQTCTASGSQRPVSYIIHLNHSKALPQWYQLSREIGRLSKPPALHQQQHASQPERQPCPEAYNSYRYGMTRVASHFCHAFISINTLKHRPGSHYMRISLVLEQMTTTQQFASISCFAATAKLHLKRLPYIQMDTGYSCAWWQQ